MNEPGDRRGGAESARSLREAIRRVRTAEAERSDVVVELRDAERARLEMLADELKAILAELPEDNDAFPLTVAGGTPPRLWVDMTAFVAMGRDRRTYRFLKDTRLGRTVILESEKLEAMADCVTNYVAERIVERERALEGDWVAKRAPREEAGARRANFTDEARPPVDRRAMGWVAAAFMFGVLMGVVGLFGYAWIAVPPL